MRNILLIIFIFIATIAQAAPPTRAFTYVSNTTINPAQNNTNENALYTYLQTGVDTYAAGSITGSAISSSASIPYVSLSLAGSITRSDLSSSSFVALPSGAIFYMITGSCPSGTTDVSATYANKFIKVNATAGTLSGAILTGTTDTHTLTAAESGLPAHTHRTPAGQSGGGAFSGSQAWSSGVTQYGADGTSESTGGSAAASGHTHTISSATTLEPVSVTAKLCQVN